MEKNSYYKVLTAALLIAGNTIGAGMLGFPVLTGLAGCVPAFIGVTIIWLIMLLTGFIIAKRMTLPNDKVSGLPTLYERELGKSGKRVATLGYLINYYGIIVAYLSGASLIGAHLLPEAWHLSELLLMIIFFVIFTGFTLFGENIVRHGNFVLMLLLTVTFVALIVIAGKSIEFDRLKYIDWEFFPMTIPIILVVFTYHNTVPVACRILKYDRVSVYKALFVGTLMPWLLTVIWLIVVIGSVPLSGGEHSLLHAFENNYPATIPMSKILGSNLFLTIGFIFAMLAIVTSYVAVGTGLLGFMKDLTKPFLPFRNRLTDALFAFGPPFIVTLIYPDLFLSALNIAGGVGVAIVFGLLPGIILIKVSKGVVWKKTIGLLLVIFFCLALVMEIAQEAGMLKIHPSVEHWTSVKKVE